MRIKDIINKILYRHYNSLNEFLLVISDRINESGVRYIEFIHIRHVDNNYLYIGLDMDNVVAIPIHRVLRIEKKSGEVVWSRSTNTQ